MIMNSYVIYIIYFIWENRIDTFQHYSHLFLNQFEIRVYIVILKGIFLVNIT